MKTLTHDERVAILDEVIEATLLGGISPVPAVKAVAARHGLTLKAIHRFAEEEGRAFPERNHEGSIYRDDEAAWRENWRVRMAEAQEAAKAAAHLRDAAMKAALSSDNRMVQNSCSRPTEYQV